MEIEEIDKSSIDNAINETIQLCVFMLEKQLKYDSIMISIIQTDRVKRLFLKNNSNRLDLSFIPEQRSLDLNNTKGIVEMSWTTGETFVYNSKKEIYHQTALQASKFPANLERLVSFSIQDFIFTLYRTSNLPLFSAEEINKIEELKLILSKVVQISLSLEKMRIQEKRREKTLSITLFIPI